MKKKQKSNTLHLKTKAIWLVEMNSFAIPKKKKKLSKKEALTTHFQIIYKQNTRKKNLNFYVKISKDSIILVWSCSIKNYWFIYYAFWYRKSHFVLKLNSHYAYKYHIRVGVILILFNLLLFVHEHACDNLFLMRNGFSSFLQGPPNTFYFGKCFKKN